MAETPSPWIKGAVAVMAVGIPLVVGGVGAYVSVIRDDFSARDSEHSRRLDVIEGLVGGHSVSLSAALERNDSHEHERQRAFDRIRSFERRLEDAVSQEQIDWLTNRVSEVAGEMAESRRYYQETVIPMIQQSNQLQMQRIQQGMKK